MSIKSRLIASVAAFAGDKPKNSTLAAKQNDTSTSGKDKGSTLPHKPKAVARTRQDIKTWNDALSMFQSEEPKSYLLQLTYNDIMIDAFLSSQIENRIQQVHSVGFAIYGENGDKDEEATAIIQKLSARRHYNRYALESIYYGYSLVENHLSKNIMGDLELSVQNIPRTNVVPHKGLFYSDYSEDATIAYREMKEFGTWVLEFYRGDLGLINKAAPHVIFKRFAQSCWSELCEIYGIPPRVLKTDTQDDEMLSRAEDMMNDVGAAAWFIIDSSEEFEFATGANTNGDVYKNLINNCTNELSLLITGAVIGQDTQNGSRSKDESAQDMLWQLVLSDMAMLEDDWNNTILPSLIKMGVLKAGKYQFRFDEVEDLEQLWKMTQEAMQHYDFDVEWLKSKFGLEVIAKKESGDNAQKLAAHFFD